MQTLWQLSMPIKRSHEWLAAIALIGLTVGLHASSLQGFWRADDGDHLLFAVTHHIWDYFINPQAIVGHSGAHVTPWNPFFYDVNLNLFGWEPRWHYAHLLLMIVAGTLATYALLRQWVQPLPALLGASAFALGAPTYSVGQYLMTGHYATGLVFSALALIAFQRSNTSAWRCSGPLLYALACLCKEVFVPLVGILPFMVKGPLQHRAHRVWPYAVVAIAYFGLRFASLGSVVGGYDFGSTTPAERLSQLLNIPALIFGTGRWAAVGVALAVALPLVVVLVRPAARLPLAVGCILVLGPLVPLTAFPGLHAPDRYLFVLWWAWCLALAFSFDIVLAWGLALLRRWFSAAPGAVLCLLLFGTLVLQHVNNRKQVDAETALFDALFRASFTQRQGDILLPPLFATAYLHETLTHATQAYRLDHRTDSPNPHIVANYEEALATLPLDAHLSEYDAACHCIQDATARLAELRQLGERSRQRYVAGKPLHLLFTYQNGRVHWEFGADFPLTSGSRFLFVDGEGRKFDIGTSGTMGYPKGRPVKLRMDYVSAEGWMAATPYFDFDPQSHPSVQWHGASVAMNQRR